MKKIILYFLLIINCSVSAQDNGIEWYSTENGLPQNSVKDILKDSYGFLWLSTENGVVRYDGNQFLKYNRFPISSMRFSVFQQDPRGNLFNSTEYSKHSITISRRKARLATKPIKETRKIDQTTYLLMQKLEISDNVKISWFENLYIDTQKGIYYFSEKGAFYVSKSGKRNEINFPKEVSRNLYIKFFCVKDILYYADPVTRKLYQIENGLITKTFEQDLLTDPNSKIIWNHNNRQVFLLNKKTLYLFNLQNTPKLTKLFEDQTFTDYKCSTFYYDSYYQTLYAGTYTNGFFTLKKPLFKTIKDTVLPEKNSFYSTLPLSDSTVICPAGRIISKNGILKRLDFIKSNEYIVEFDEEHNILITRYGKLHKYYRKTGYATSSQINFPDTEIMDILKDRKQNFMALRIRNKRAELVYSEPKEPLKITRRVAFTAMINKLYKLNDDFLLLGTLNGLYKMDIRKGKPILLGLRNVQIRDIIKTSEGNLWVTTFGGGIFFMKNNRLIKMPIDEEKSILSAHTIVEDPYNYLWIPTNNGLYRVDKRQMLLYADNNKHPIHFYRFSKKDGFSTNEFNGGGHPSHTKLKNGQFVLPSLHGLVFFNPKSINNIYPKNGFYAERGVLDGKEIEIGKRLELKQDFSRLDIYIDVPYFGSQDNLLIQAKHTGNAGNNNWETVGKDRKYSLTNLAPGAHSITIRVLKSAKGQFYYHSFQIYVKPYLYQTGYFWFIIFILTLLFIYIFITLREKKLQKVNQLLEKTVQEKTQELQNTILLLEDTTQDLLKESSQQKKLIGTITHDITTPIKFITMGLNTLMEKKSWANEMTLKVIQSLHQSSSQLFLFSKTLKQYADIYNENKDYEKFLYPLYELVEEKKKLFEEIAIKNGTNILNLVNPKEQLMVNRNILSAILHNLMDNAVKNTENGEVIIDFVQNKTDFILEIKDTGIGMNHEQMEYYTAVQENLENDKLTLQKFGLGLHLIIELLQMINGKLIIQKNTPKGTIIQIKININEK